MAVKRIHSCIGSGSVQHYICNCNNYVALNHFLRGTNWPVLKQGWSAKVACQFIELFESVDYSMTFECNCTS